jgi:MFS family permease
VGTLTEIVSAYRGVARNPSLRRVLAAFGIFNAQEYAIWLAITIYAYGRGGATEAGAVAVAQLIPAAVVAPLGSVLGDRMRRDRALALGYVLQSITAAMCAIALWVAPALVVYAFAILSSCSITLTRPVHYSLLPPLCSTPEELTAANSLSSTAEGLGIFAGPLLNSLFVWIEGPGAVCAAFAVLTAIAAAMTARLAVRDEVDADGLGPERSESAEDELEGLLRSAARGVAELAHDPPAAFLVVFGGVQFLILGVLDVFLVVLAVEVLGLGEGGTGVLNAAVGVGGLAGAAATAILVGRARLASPIEIAVALMGGVTAAIAFDGGVATTLLLLALAGAARSFFDVAARTLLQRSVRQETLSRVFGLQEALMMVGLAFGAGLAPLMLSAFGQRGAFVATGLMIPAAGLATWPALAALDRRATRPDARLTALLAANPIFQPLAQPELERLAGAVGLLDLPAGTPVITQGDAGDRFYLIETGTALVTVDGVRVNTLGPRDHFGEIALLRDVPRTATVVAVSDLRVLTLEREPFLASVAWSRPSAERLNAEIDRRLTGPQDG